MKIYFAGVLGGDQKRELSLQKVFVSKVV